MYSQTSFFTDFIFVKLPTHWNLLLSSESVLQMCRMTKNLSDHTVPSWGWVGDTPSSWFCFPCRGDQRVETGAVQTRKLQLWGHQMGLESQSLHLFMGPCKHLWTHTYVCSSSPASALTPRSDLFVTSLADSEGPSTVFSVALHIESFSVTTSWSPWRLLGGRLSPWPQPPALSPKPLCLEYVLRPSLLHLKWRRELIHRCFLKKKKYWERREGTWKTKSCFSCVSQGFFSKSQLFFAVFIVKQHKNVFQPP